MEEINKGLLEKLGLNNEDYNDIIFILKRNPTLTELAIFSAMWSEHCSYKSSKHWLKKLNTKATWVIQGPGENAGVIDIGDKFQLVSTDLLVEKVHFDLAYTPLKHLGYKAVAVNVSDICAMNGKAKQIVIGLALSNRFPVEALEELYAGINLACKQYGVDIVGGDTTSSTSGLMISVTAIGEVEKEKIIQVLNNIYFKTYLLIVIVI